MSFPHGADARTGVVPWYMRDVSCECVGGGSHAVSLWVRCSLLGDGVHAVIRLTSSRVGARSSAYSAVLRASALCALALNGEQPRVAQDFQVMGHREWGQLQLYGDFSDAARRTGS